MLSFFLLLSVQEVVTLFYGKLLYKTDYYLMDIQDIETAAHFIYFIFCRSGTASRTGCHLGPREQINQVYIPGRHIDILYVQED